MINEIRWYSLKFSSSIRHNVDGNVRRAKHYFQILHVIQNVKIAHYGHSTDMAFVLSITTHYAENKSHPFVHAQ